MQGLFFSFVKIITEFSTLPVFKPVKAGGKNLACFMIKKMLFASIDDFETGTHLKHLKYLAFFVLSELMEIVAIMTMMS